MDMSPCLKAASSSSSSILRKSRLQGPNPKAQIIQTKWSNEYNNNHHHPNGGSTTTTDVLHLMDSLQLPIQADIYASLLKECTHSRDAVRSAELHTHIARSRVRPGSFLLSNRLLLMHVACDRLDTALHLFDKMPRRNSISWETVILGQAENNNHEQALRLFADMQENGVQALTHLILLTVIKSCTHLRDVKFGKQVHGWVSKMCDTSKDLFLGSSFIDFYGKLGCLESARRVFDQMCYRDTVIWTAMIVVYCQQDQFIKALKVFKEMGRAGKRKNNFTFSSALRACGRMQDGGRCGRQVHANAIKVGVELDSFLQCSLVDMYSKSGLLNDAIKVFQIIRRRNAECWNAMLSGYTQNRCCNEAIKLLYEMKAAGVEPQESMVNEVRIACGE